MSNMPNNIRFVAERNGARRCITLFATCDQGSSGEKSVVIPTVELQTMASGEMLPEFMALSFKESQNLMDELFACGVRPSEGGDASGVVAAKNEHLEDLRTQLKNMWIRDSNIFKQPDETD